MPEFAISTENLWKKYRLGPGRSQTIRQALSNPFSASSKSDFFWALKNINLDIKHGEALGIIGKNGAGKSTFLKVLSRITTPTRGRVEIHGRVSSLLEVGTGFHPELTGKENVYLNGTILGMSRKEVKNKFEEVIDFSGVHEFINTPIKHYSSGMKVRLAFSVAAHLEPDVLIVDEVLAVGDMSFQKKCLGKMDEVSKAGRTVILVSHNLEAVASLCRRGVVIENGELKYSGNVSHAIKEYRDSVNLANSDLSKNSHVNLNDHPDKTYKRGLGMIKAELFRNEIATAEFNTLSNFKLAIEFKIDFSLNEIVFGFIVKNKYQNQVFGLNNLINKQVLVLGGKRQGTIIVDVPQLLLTEGEYAIDLFLSDGYRSFDIIEGAIGFTVLETDIFGSGKLLYKNQNVFHQPGLRFELC